MIILVSDIHLTDTKERTTFPTENFLKNLESGIKCGIEDITIVLLGDIFEILKSSKWLVAGIRPWQECTSAHVQTVEAILSSIIQANPDFFVGINNLKAAYPSLNFIYIPGNHDRPLNTKMGEKARVILQQKLPLQEEQGKLFQPLFQSESHQLIAKHGHEWDGDNRYGEFGGANTVAFGDAIVIDLILRLPQLVREALKIDFDDPLLTYLHEIDNLRPHTLRVIGQWLNGGLAELQRINYKAPRIIDEAVTQLARNLRKLAMDVPFESFKLNTWRRKSASWLLLQEISIRGFLKVAHRLPWGEEERGSESSYALEDFHFYGDNFNYLVCGHTHNPLAMPIEIIGDNRPRFYINTGTWRRIRRVTRSIQERGKRTTFACWDEGSLLTIFSAQEQQAFNLPAFDLQLLTRGKQL